ncbi:MAG: hypothetical protein LBU11_01140 [Zoogloeaceae bacterium]|jgi:hypothetical protein|nr:hypothetical protein [Zoogloeaceae bacterium]
MGFFTKTVTGVAKGAKFVFWGMPKRIIGYDTLRANNKYIRDMYTTLSNPRCPDCDSGVLIIDGGAAPEEHDHHTHYYWRCSRNCGFSLLAPNNKKEVANIVQTRRQQRVLDNFGHMELTDRLNIIKWHERKAMLYMTVAAAFFLFFAYRIAMGVSIFYASGPLFMSFAFVCIGMRWNYRAWQVRESRLFVEGSFWVYLRDVLFAPRIKST